MNELTKRGLKQKIVKMSITEVISLLDIKHYTGAVDVKNENIIEVAFLVQHPHERAGYKFAQMINNKRVVIFHNALDCPIPLGTRVEAIELESVRAIVCKPIK
jgi:hypothetical protein